jgi:hypothetical protein
MVGVRIPVGAGAQAALDAGWDISDLIFTPTATQVATYPTVGYADAGVYPDINADINTNLRGITGLLQRILNAINTLAGAIALALVGDMVLDFNRFGNIGGLTGVFPLSIPWDLRNAILTIFGGGGQATPPVITIDLSETILNHKVVIDMAEFELLSTITRWSIMSTFAFGLIVATGKLIKW